MSMNDTTTIDELQFRHPLLGVLLASFCLLTLFGNTLVVVAVVTKKYLHTPTGYLIVSLAAADLIVGSMVMPFNVLFEMTNHVWLVGPVMCDVWRSVDVLASTASIWNLCVISLDRYLANSDPLSYPDTITPYRIGWAIAVVWLMSSCLSFPAIAWWHSSNPHLYLNEMKCEFTDDVYYVIFSSLVSFYIPLCIILFAYWRVFVIASKHQKFLKTGSKCIKSNRPSEDAEPSQCLRVHRGGGASRRNTPTNTESPTPSTSFRKTRRRSSASALDQLTPDNNNIKRSVGNFTSSMRHCKFNPEDGVITTRRPSPASNLLIQRSDKLKLSSSSNSLNKATSLRVDQQPSMITVELSSTASESHTQILKLKKGAQQKSKALVKYLKEKRAARTLSIVVGCFVACWLPFFVINILVVVCADCLANKDLIYTILTWLGHCNSALNPLIYSRFSREFRRAFKQILFRRDRQGVARAGIAQVLQATVGVATGHFVNLQQRSNKDSLEDDSVEN